MHRTAEIKQKWTIKPAPDFGRMEKVLRQEEVDGPVVFYELYSDIEAQVLNRLEPDGSGEGTWGAKSPLERHIAYMYRLGYDYINLGRNWDFPKPEKPQVDGTGGKRKFLTARYHAIGNETECRDYPWPDVANLDYRRFATITEVMPKGMKVIAVCAGVLENVISLLGQEGLSLAVYDKPALVSTVCEQVAQTIIAYYDRVAAFESVGALSLSDDLGFKTQTMLSPADLRKYIFPWHRQIVQTVHKYNKPIILHSCGQLEAVLEDILACGWNAKHSFEDSIEPVWQCRKKYGDRIALLGGFDMDKICRMTAEQVRQHTRFLIENCGGAGWALGTGNSVADYVPAENFLAMLEEGYRFSGKGSWP